MKLNAGVKVKFVEWKKLEDRRACRGQLTSLIQAMVKQRRVEQKNWKSGQFKIAGVWCL